jgi:hypothetical protein
MRDTTQTNFPVGLHETARRLVHEGSLAPECQTILLPIHCFYMCPEYLIILLEYCLTEGVLD